jgi:hypothetical protein
MTVRLKEKLITPLKIAFTENLSQSLQIGGIGAIGLGILGFLILASLNFGYNSSWGLQLWPH